jgi:hypothetical protein
MKSNWLESKVVSTLFFCSAVIILSFCAFLSFFAIPEVAQFTNTSQLANQLFLILFFALAYMAVPSMLFIFYGMAVFCACRDHSSIGRKALWFILFFLTGPIGSTVYYFTVYRGYIKRKRAADAGFGSLHTGHAESGRVAQV